jgi:serine/threonine protein kinase
MAARRPFDRSGGCPRREELRAFGAGKLPAPRLEAVAAHLDGCASCSCALDGLHAGPELPEVLDAAAGQLSDEELRRAAALAERAGPAPAERLLFGPSPGGQLGQYQFVDRLGAGGMGQVFKVRHRLMDRTVALKVIHARHLRRPEAVNRFRREIRALARLDHPNIVRAYDADQVDGLHFLVMEYVEGTDLARLVRERGPLPVTEACDCVRQAALGLQHAHEHGLVHRDLKPSNLIRQRSGLVKVLDLGLALFREGRPAAGAAGDGLLGTLDYMAPEQRRDPQAVDGRADVYALGCTLHYLLTGRPPSCGSGPDVPDALAAALRRMLAEDPDRRYATPAAAAEALRPFAGRAAPRPTRRTAAGLGLVAAVLGFALWAVLRGPHGPPSPEPLRVVSFRVSHHRGDPSRELGDFGVGPCLSARNPDDDARVHVELSAPAWCFLVAFDPDGQEELCHPRDGGAVPPRVGEFHYPPDRAGSARQTYFALNNGPGLQAFALVAFREPPPPYDRWRAAVGAAPWGPTAAAEGVWSFDGERLRLLGLERAERERDGPPPALDELCRFYRRCPGIDAVRVLAFPVKE